MIAREYVKEGHSTRFVLEQTGVAESTFYYQPQQGTRDRKATTTTVDAKGTAWTEQQLVDLITAELEKAAASTMATSRSRSGSSMSIRS